MTKTLAHNNYPILKLQVMSALRGAQVASFIESTAVLPVPFLKVEGDSKEEAKPNPDYESWVAKD
jgi:hypothetical protein